MLLGRMKLVVILYIGLGGMSSNAKQEMALKSELFRRYSIRGCKDLQSSLLRLLCLSSLSTPDLCISMLSA